MASFQHVGNLKSSVKYVDDRIPQPANYGRLFVGDKAMSISIELKPEVEEWLEHEAAAQGVPVEGRCR